MAGRANKSAGDKIILRKKAYIFLVAALLLFLGMGCSKSEAPVSGTEAPSNESVQTPGADMNDSESVADPLGDTVQNGDAGLSEARNYGNDKSITFWEWRSERNGCKAGDVFTFGE